MKHQIDPVVVAFFTIFVFIMAVLFFGLYGITAIAPENEKRHARLCELQQMKPISVTHGPWMCVDEAGQLFVLKEMIKQ